MSYKLLSLFDGSGGFPLAGSMCGIEPVAAAEVEPYPIAVARSRFPGMKHLGDVSKINGAEIEPVDVITFGSPCQDLSIAGKRAGLKHEANGDEETTRSGLFMEAVRIIKEMREATNGVYPKFALWENVPGAFSSNHGNDFRVVCEELIKIVEPAAVMPPVPKNGWAYADSYVGDGWSLAYRVFDAQYWGVPQRRRRIHLVLHLTGGCARAILFERQGLRGYFAESRTPWKGIAADAENCSGAADREGAIPYTLKIKSGCEGGGKGALIQTNKSATLSTLNDQYLFQPIGCIPINTMIATSHNQLGRNTGFGIGEDGDPQFTLSTAHCHAVFQQFLFENHSQDTRYKGPLEVCPMLPAQLGTGGNNQPFVVERRSEPVRYNGENITSPLNKTDPKPGDPCHTLGTDSRNWVCIPCAAYSIGNGQLNQISMSEVCNTLDCMHDQQAVLVNRTIVFDKEVYNSGVNATGGHYIAEGGPAPSLRTKHPPGVVYFYIVRRIIPIECARLQGFADAWGVPDKKDDFTDEEYRFWLEVRNTHAAINGKKVQDYTKVQMLTWYNKLHTDSAEYKLWGNGIALPPALYCMQGIVDALEEEVAYG